MIFKKTPLFPVVSIAPVFLLVFFLVGCEVPVPKEQNSTEKNSTDQNQSSGEATTPNIPDYTTVPGVSPSVDTSLVKMKSSVTYGFTGNRLVKAQSTVALMLRVLSSQEFKDRVLNYAHNGMKQFYSTNDTNAEVYKTIIAGAENFNTTPDNTVNLNLNIYTPSIFNKWGTVGYTYANSDQIYTNVNYFDSYTAANLAGHWAHEWTHKLGYEHDFNSTSQRPYSVPYAIGDLVDELASKL